MTRGWLLLVAWLALAAPAGADEVDGGGFGVAGGYAWEEARERLLVELRPATSSQAGNAIFRQDIPHTRTALILMPTDPEGAPYDVTLADAFEWQRTGEQLFRLALDNLARQFPPRVRQTPKLAKGVRVNLFYDDSPYAAGHAIEMAQHKTCIGRKGAIVAVPNPYALLCYPIDTEQAVHGYVAMVQIATDIFREGIDPLVPHVYWFNRGRWETQRVVLGDEDTTFARTRAFDAMMKGLPADKPDIRKRRW